MLGPGRGLDYVDDILGLLLGATKSWLWGNCLLGGSFLRYGSGDGDLGSGAIGLGLVQEGIRHQWSVGSGVSRRKLPCTGVGFS
jgi:hypothetical protein